MATDPKRVTLSEPGLAGEYTLVEQRPDGSLLLRPDYERLPAAEALDGLRRLVEKELGKQRGSEPSPLDAHDYARLWESLGHTAQLVCDTGDSWGMYYTVYALYEVEHVFATQPLAVIFSDFSKPTEVTWAFPRGAL